MRSFLLSSSAKIQLLTVVGLTVIVAFTIALIFGTFFDVQQLKANTNLISSVYQVMGTIYAILLTFSLWGVWQRYTDADNAVQKEAYTLLDLVHIIETSPRWSQFKIRDAVCIYAESVIKLEWDALKSMTSSIINIREQNNVPCLQIVDAVQQIQPEGAREQAIFAEALTLLSNWLDARRTRILVARGNSAHALWPLLLTGAFVLFAFHGLFVAQTQVIWITLLAGTSLVIGLTFYLIFTLDCPFAGAPCIDPEPFHLTIDLLKSTHTLPIEHVIA